MPNFYQTKKNNLTFAVLILGLMVNVSSCKDECNDCNTIPKTEDGSKPAAYIDEGVSIGIDTLVGIWEKIETSKYAIIDGKEIEVETKFPHDLYIISENRSFYERTNKANHFIGIWSVDDDKFCVIPAEEESEKNIYTIMSYDSKREILELRYRNGDETNGIYTNIYYQRGNDYRTPVSSIELINGVTYSFEFQSIKGTIGGFEQNGIKFLAIEYGTNGGKRYNSIKLESDKPYIAIGNTSLYNCPKSEALLSSTIEKIAFYITYKGSSVYVQTPTSDPELRNAGVNETIFAEM